MTSAASLVKRKGLNCLLLKLGWGSQERKSGYFRRGSTADKNAPPGAGSSPGSRSFSPEALCGKTVRAEAGGLAVFLQLPHCLYFLISPLCSLGSPRALLSLHLAKWSLWGKRHLAQRKFTLIVTLPLPGCGALVTPHGE